MTFRADLHIHSCLSPCGSLEASPRALADAAARAGLAMAALTDHNSALNAPAFATACRAVGVVPLFGIEVTTAEEAHVLALFEAAAAALELGRELYLRLTDVLNVPERFGDQVWVNDEEEIEGEVEKLLIGAVDFSVDRLAERVLSAGGLLIPAHLDRPSFSLVGQLGFLPPLAYSAVELTGPAPDIQTNGAPVVTASDAHHPADVGRRWISFDGRLPDFGALASALKERRVRPWFDEAERC